MDMKQSSKSSQNEYTGLILVVDDERKNRVLLRDVLEANGHHVIEAEDGEQALQKVVEEQPDVILLDIMMPGINGFEVCRRLKNDTDRAHIPVLMVTSLTERDDRLRGIQEGANDFISKPIDVQDVVLRVRNAVYSKHLFDQVQENYRRLKDLEALRDNLVHMIIHDLRQPITGVSGYLQLMEFDNTLKEEQKKIVRRASTAVTTLIEMVSSLLDVNRLEEGKMSLNLRQCEMKFLVEEAVETLGFLADRHSIHVESSGDHVSAFCDGDIIRRVITNLVGNALRFTPKGGEIRVTIESRDSNTRIAITDTGIGIPQEYHEKIFDKFGQVEARSEGKKYSTGLGLTFCKLAVEAHGGEIGVESEPGKGSTFWFVLPGVAGGKNEVVN